MEKHQQAAEQGQNGEILSMQQVHHLIEILEHHEWKACAAAVALMLWGGVGFNSLRHLRWQNVLDTTSMNTPKMPEQAAAWMMKQGYLGVPEAPILPRGWNRRWLRLKQELGINDARVLTATYQYYLSQECGPILPPEQGH